MKTLAIQVPDELWQAFTEIAARDGRTTEAVCMEYLVRHSPRRSNRTPEEVEAARQRLHRHFGSVKTGNPRAADNDRIDADLVSEYSRGI
jgi:hypothetical protein